MKFISFGCWNKGDPKKSEYPINHLLDELNKFLSTTKVDFIVITGDNYYSNIPKGKNPLDNVENKYKMPPYKQLTNYIIEGGGDKEEKITYCNIDHLVYVFIRLRQISNYYKIPIYMCSGNHEYKNHIIFKSLNSPTVDIPDEPGEDISEEVQETIESLGLDLSLNHSLLDIQKKIFECEACKACKFIESGRFLIEELPFFVINTEKDQIDSNEDIIKLINQETNKIYIFGHIPILSLKEKKGKHMVVNDYLVDLFCELREGIIVTYICADTHNYQDITITFENGTLVNQVILGTGGTFELDDITNNMTELNSITLPDKIKYIYIKEATTGIHGFGLFDTGVEAEYEPSHKFIGFGVVNVGGYKPKNTKNKKYKKIITKRRYNKRKTKRRKTKRRTNKRKTKKRKNNKNIYTYK